MVDPEAYAARCRLLLQRGFSADAVIDIHAEQSWAMLLELEMLEPDQVRVFNRRYLEELE